MGVNPQRRAFLEPYIADTHIVRAGRKTTVCCITLYNGFEIIGTSAPADVRLFNADLGKRYAFEDALLKMDSYFAFLQQDRAHVEQMPRDDAE